MPLLIEDRTPNPTQPSISQDHTQNFTQLTRLKNPILYPHGKKVLEFTG